MWIPIVVFAVGALLAVLRVRRHRRRRRQENYLGCRLIRYTLPEIGGPTNREQLLLLRRDSTAWLIELTRRTYPLRVSPN